MPRSKTKGRIVFATPWFQVASRKPRGARHPLYSIHSPDFVVVVATTRSGHLLLVRQFRHALGRATLEPPSGHVDRGETPEQAARRELREETGYEAGSLELLATLSPSPARYTNRLWCYFAGNARPRAGAGVERGVRLVVYRKDVKSLLAEKAFCSAAGYGALCVAMLRGRLKVRLPAGRIRRGR